MPNEARKGYKPSFVVAAIVDVSPEHKKLCRDCTAKLLELVVVEVGGNALKIVAWRDHVAEPRISVLTENIHVLDNSINNRGLPGFLVAFPNQPGHQRTATLLPGRGIQPMPVAGCLGVTASGSLGE